MSRLTRAYTVGEEIVANEVFDQRFCEKADRRREDRVLAASRWTNTMLGPPSQDMGALIFNMSQNRKLADEFTEEFQFPPNGNGTGSPRPGASMPGLPKRQSARDRHAHPHRSLPPSPTTRRPSSGTTRAHYPIGAHAAGPPQSALRLSGSVDSRRVAALLHLPGRIRFALGDGASLEVGDRGQGRRRCSQLFAEGCNSGFTFSANT